RPCRRKQHDRARPPDVRDGNHALWPRRAGRDARTNAQIPHTDRLSALRRAKRDAATERSRGAGTNDRGRRKLECDRPDRVKSSIPMRRTLTFESLRRWIGLTDGGGRQPTAQSDPEQSVMNPYAAAWDQYVKDIKPKAGQWPGDEWANEEF